MNDRLLMIDSLQCSFLNVKKPPKQSTCPICCGGPDAIIRCLEDSRQDLQQARAPGVCSYEPLPLDEEHQISCLQYSQLCKNSKSLSEHVLLDVRVEEQYNLCYLNEAKNIPFEQLKDRLDQVEELSDKWNKPIYCICRRGVLSAEATKLLNEYWVSEMITKEDGTRPVVKNIKGGLEAWRRQVDENFPKY